MRRTPAILLLLLFLGGIGSPFFATGLTTTPACCRRDGAHHCMGTTTPDGFRSGMAGCPYRSVHVVARSTVALTVARTSIPLSDAQIAIARFEFSPPAFYPAEAHQPRGPPAS